MLDRRSRLLSTLQGKPVDRVPVSFYEINGLDELDDVSDPFNIYTHPTWEPVIRLAREKTDRIVMRTVQIKRSGELSNCTKKETWQENGQKFNRLTIKTNSRLLKSLSRRDRDVNTVWQIEPLLKDEEDLRAYLDLPVDNISDDIDFSSVLKAETSLGDSGIVMLDTPDPICIAASLFELGAFTVIATQETSLVHQLLERFYVELEENIELISSSLPGHLWRIYGPEYASPPYLHPKLFADYVVRYDQPLVDIIHRHGGYARVHSHGNLRAILDLIAAMGVDGLDPIEPPPQGDIELIEVRKRIGHQVVLFGNLEASDLEMLPPDQFAKKIQKALREGTEGEGRGFVLMPSACPYGRRIPENVIENYSLMVELAERGNY